MYYKMNMFTKICIKEQGIIAKLFLPKNAMLRNAIIVLDSSISRFNEPVAQALARKSYIALALAYFGIEGFRKSVKSRIDALKPTRNEL
jgi:hypothetical protein